MRRIAFLACLCACAGSAHAGDVHELWECKGVVIRQFGPMAVRTGDLVTYRIRIVNEGSCDLQGVLITDFIPRLSEFKLAVPAPSQVTQEPAFDVPPPLPVAKVVWSDVRLAPSGNERDYQITIAVRGDPGRTLSNSVCIQQEKAGRLCDTFDVFVR